MGGTGWIAGAVVMGVLTGWSDATAETSKSLTLPVLVLDGVGLPAETPRQTQAEAGRIFTAAGVTLTWLPAGEPAAGSLIIKLVATRIGQKSKNPNVLGVTPGTKESPGRTAFLFYHRVHDLARFLHLDVPVLLGHVIAHEMGHLLLPYGSHAAAGLMKAGWDNQQAILAATGSLTFEPSQAARIRAHLTDKTNP